jgi:hypothetical protein
VFIPRINERVIVRPWGKRCPPRSQLLLWRQNVNPGGELSFQKLASAFNLVIVVVGIHINHETIIQTNHVFKFKRLSLFRTKMSLKITIAVTDFTYIWTSTRHSFT